MRSALSCVLVASVASALAFPLALSAQDEMAQLERSCDAGEKYACERLAVRVWSLSIRYLLGSDGVPKDSARADSLRSLTLSLYERGCELGAQRSCVELTEMRNLLPQERVIWAMQRACDLREGAMCLRLGLMYDLGFQGVPKDTARASELFKKGCLFDNKEACNLIRR